MTERTEGADSAVDPAAGTPQSPSTREGESSSVPPLAASPAAPDDKHREHYCSGYSAGWSDGRNGSPMEDARKCAMFFGPEIHEACGGLGCDACKGTGEKPIPIAAASPTAPSLERDARRYRRLQILGCAPCGSKQLDNGSVLRFANLDSFVDADLTLHPSRGEAYPLAASPAAEAPPHDDAGNGVRHHFTPPSNALCVHCVRPEHDPVHRISAPAAEAR